MDFVFTLTHPSGIRAVILAVNSTEAKLALCRHLKYKIPIEDFVIESYIKTHAIGTVISVFEGMPE